jgi:putative oxidoreductase
MPDAVLALGRALMSVIFIVSGFNKFMAVAGTTAYLTRLGVPSPQIMVYVVAALELIGGLMILVGFKTRWVALVMCVFTGITVFLGHKFWAVDAAQYQNQLNHALKNLAIMGGFLVLAGAGPGRYSVDGRAG